MATVTASIGLNSRDISDNGLNISKAATLTQAGVNTGVTGALGISNRTLSAAQFRTLIDYSTEDVTGNAAKLYIKNTSSSTVQYVSVHIGEQQAGSDTNLNTADDTVTADSEIARLYGGDWMFIPYTGGNTADIVVKPSTADEVTLEYMVIY